MAIAMASSSLQQWKCNPLLLTQPSLTHHSGRRRVGNAIVALGDPFVLELAEKLEESASSNNLKKQEPPPSQRNMHRGGLSTSMAVCKGREFQIYRHKVSETVQDSGLGALEFPFGLTGFRERQAWSLHDSVN